MQYEKLQKRSFLRCHAAEKCHKKSSLSELQKSKRKTKSIFKRISTVKVGTNKKVRTGSGGRRLKGGGSRWGICLEPTNQKKKSPARNPPQEGRGLTLEKNENGRCADDAASKTDDDKECSTCFLNQRGTKGKNTGKGEVGRGEGGWMQGEKLQKISFFRCHAAAKFHKKSSVSDLEKSKRQIKSIIKRINQKKLGGKGCKVKIFRK